MPNLLEDPLPYLFIGVAVEAVLAVLLVKTGRGAFLVAILAVLGVVAAGIAVERFVVTEREQVENALDDLAAALEANDIDGVLSLISPQAANSRSRARWALERIEVQSAKVRNLEVSVNRLTSPPTAKARFYGVILFEDRLGQIPYQTYAADFSVEFRREADRWVITGHVEHDPRM